MVKNKKVNIVLLLIVCLLWLSMSGFIMTPTAVSLIFETEPADVISVYVDGMLSTECANVDGEAYMTLEQFGKTFDLPCSKNEICGAALNVSDSGEYAEISGRYFYLDSQPQQLDGETYWPVTMLAKLLGHTLVVDRATNSVNIDENDTAGSIESGDTYYDEDDVYWLSRIINAESGNQALDGMLGVGNVVLNRVHSSAFPDGVYEVIFDSRYGIQFSPVQTGGIYAEPSELAVIAAKLCLEGCDIAGDSLYFVNPDVGITQWFRNTRTFVDSIGDHDFYA